jgi:hypothetical protein
MKQEKITFADLKRFIGAPIPVDSLTTGDRELQPLLVAASQTHFIKSSLGRGTCFAYNLPNEHQSTLYITAGHVLSTPFVEFARALKNPNLFPKLLTRLQSLLLGPNHYAVSIGEDSSIRLGPDALAHYLFAHDSGHISEMHGKPKTSILTPSRTLVKNSDGRWGPEDVEKVRQQMANKRGSGLRKTDIAIFAAPNFTTASKTKPTGVSVLGERVLESPPTPVVKSHDAKAQIREWAKKPQLGINGIIPREEIEGKQFFALGYPALKPGYCEKTIIPLGQADAFRSDDHTITFRHAASNWGGISGGPVILEDGRVIGIATAISQDPATNTWQLHIVDLAYQLNLVGELT